MDPDVYVCTINSDHKWLVPGDCPFCENIDLKVKLNGLEQDFQQAMRVIVVMRERIAELSGEE